MSLFDQVLADTKPTESSIDICIAGDLFGRHQELSRQLEELRGANPGSLGGGGGTEVAQQIVELEKEMAKHTITVHFKAVPRTKFESERQKHTKDDGNQMKDSWFPTLVALSVIGISRDGERSDESLSVKQVEEWFDQLSEGQRDALFSGAWDANHIGGDIPKSLVASALVNLNEPS